MSYTKDEIIAHRKAWTDALRSGDYAQTGGALHRVRKGYELKLFNTPGYCCLGVACDVYVKAGEGGVWKPGYDGEEEFEAGFGSRSFWPDSVADYFGFGHPLCLFTSSNGPVDFIAANDVLRLDFAQIADIIEKAPVE